jgi:hypothetical protein
VIAALLILALSAPKLDIAVPPIAGDPAATRLCVDMVGSVDGLKAISLERIGEVLGPDAASKLAACTEDQCYAQAILPVRADGILIGTVEEDAGRNVLRMRLVVTSTRGALSPARSTHEIDRGGLASAMSSAMAELFPEQAKRSFGTLLLTNVPDNAELQLDGKVFGVLSGASTALRVRAGVHQVAVRAPGHDSWSGETNVVLGQTTSLELGLSKRRSNSPYIVAGIGVAAAVGATVLGLVAESTASGWKDACQSGQCTGGYTRERYADDRSNVDRYRVSANALFVASGLAIAGGFIWYLVDPGEEDDL